MADNPELVRALGILVILLALLWGGLWLARRLGVMTSTATRRALPRRIEIVSRTAIDPRRMLLLVRRDGREHLLLIAPEGPLLIEAGIRQAADPFPALVDRLRDSGIAA